MKKVVGVLLVLGLAVMLIGLVGCGGEKKAVVDVNGEQIEVTEENGEIKVETEEGEETITTSDVDLDELGIPIYPGAKMAEGEMSSVTTETAEGTGTLVTLETSDSASEVAAWYKDQLSGKDQFYDMESSAAEGGEMYMYSYMEGNTFNSVTITVGELGDQAGKTVITIVSGSGEMMDSL